jgi:hypothetical protein
LEVQRPADPHLAIGAWGAKGPLFTSAHPTEAHLGIRLQLGFVLEKRAGLLRHLQDVFEPRVLALDLLLGAFLGPDRARPPPAVLQPVQRAAKCLAARGGEPLSLISCRHRSLQLQRERSQPRSVGKFSSVSSSMSCWAESSTRDGGPRLLLFKGRRLAPPA